MKKYLLIALVSLFAFASCSKESSEAPEVNTDKTVNLTFTSKRPQLKSDTKTAWDAASSSIFWSTGDKIRVGYTLNGDWMGQSSAGSAKFYTSDAVSIDLDNQSLGTFKVPISGSNFADPKTSGSYQFYAIYPSSILTSTSVSNPSAQSITVPTTQTLESGTFDSRADILVGQSSAMALEGLPTDPISLSWTRLVAHADLTFSNLAFVGTEIVNKITLTFNEDAKVAGAVSVNIPAGTAGTGSSNVLELSSSTGISSSSSSFEAWACVLPVTFTSLNVEIKTDKATYTKSISGFGSRTFKKNARNTLTINMNEAIRTEISGQLVANGYYVVSYNNKMMTVGTEGNAYRGYADKNTEDPSSDAIWAITYVSSSGAYTIHSVSVDKDLYGSTSSNSTLSFSSGSNLTNLFEIEKTDSESTTYKISPKEGSRHLGYNISSPRFAIYVGSDQLPIAIDLTSVTYVPDPVINVTSDNPMSVANTASTGTIQYTIDNPTSATLTASTTASWISIINYGTGTVTFDVAAQESGATARSGVITLKYTGAPDVDVTVNQAAGEGGSSITTLTNANIKAAGAGATGYSSWSLKDDNNNSYSAYAIKNQHSNATSNYHYLQIRKYNSPTAYYIQIPELGTKITQIKMTVSGSSQPMTGGSNTATLYFSASNTTSSTGTGVASGTGASSVTIDCSSLNLNTGYITAGGAVRIWDIEITYE